MWKVVCRELGLLKSRREGRTTYSFLFVELGSVDLRGADSLRASVGAGALVRRIVPIVRFYCILDMKSVERLTVVLLVCLAGMFGVPLADAFFLSLTVLFDLFLDVLALWIASAALRAAFFSLTKRDRALWMGSGVDAAD